MREKIELPVPLDDVLRRYETGEMLPDIAKSIGLSERTLYRRLLENHDKWKAAQQAQALQRYEFAKEKHKEAMISLEALRAKLDEEGEKDSAARKWRLAHVTAIEQAWDRAVHRAEWELERLLRRLYGQDQQVNNGAPIQINIGITRSGEIDVTP
jgi:hypothetical protein